jgi:hypothetical protein
VCVCVCVYINIYIYIYIYIFSLLMAQYEPKYVEDMVNVKQNNELYIICNCIELDVNKY